MSVLEAILYSIIGIVVIIIGVKMIIGKKKGKKEDQNDTTNED